MRSERSRKPSLWLYYGALVSLSLGAILLVSFFPSDALAIGFITSFLVVALSFCFFLSIRMPLHEMRRGAERYSKGQFSQKLPGYHMLEIADLGEAMNSMGSQLEHLEEVRRDFIANVSHELKTPITSIKGFVETLLDGAMDDREDLEKFLDIIDKQAERLTLIIEDLLTLARLESGNIEELLIPGEEQVRDVLGSVVEMCSESAKSKQIKIDVACDEDVKAVFDRSLIEQAVGNLITNAVKYSGPQSNVRVNATNLADGVEITVSDDGPGIAPEHLPRLFERFYRVDKARTRRVGGTGLGLAIVKHIASVHKGTVSVDSRLGEGSTFCIKLPAE